MTPWLPAWTGPAVEHLRDVDAARDRRLDCAGRSSFSGTTPGTLHLAGRDG